MLGNKPGNVKMYLKIRELLQQISKIQYVKWVANRHVITNSMYIGHTR